MISLPVCRWRDEPRPANYLCRSSKFVAPPNVVRAACCAACRCADHEPPPSLPRSLPCVHLGGSGGKELASKSADSKSAAGQMRHPVFKCARHGHCVVSWKNAKPPRRIHSCATCPDYLARDPFGPNSMQMRRRADQFLAAVPPYPAKRYQGRGVVIAGGGDRYFASLYVTVRALRRVGCRLPIQVWYLGRHDEMPRARQALLAPWQVECVDADQVRRRHPARRLDGWELKVFATLHSPFEELLFLDADCYPCRNPEFLFELPDYRAQGAVFWPDLTTIDTRLKWPAFGVPDPHRAGSVESGQFLCHKRTCWRPLNLAWFYNDHSDYYYRYCYGDKHTFEVAWTRCARPYVMWEPTSRWQDVAYLHGGPDGVPVFVHRCSDKFRFDPQTYITQQQYRTARYHAALPLERECWGWMTELARLTGRDPHSLPSLAGAKSTNDPPRLKKKKGDR